jgi:hypothetical protein|tara:strand:- start:79 stop:276 length:198 start_codon:yes stop_codon:yes gene_type:complete
MRKRYYKLREEVLEVRKDLVEINEIIEKYLNREKIFLSEINKLNKVLGHKIPIEMTSIIQSKEYS